MRRNRRFPREDSCQAGFCLFPRAPRVNQQAATAYRLYEVGAFRSGVGILSNPSFDIRHQQCAPRYEPLPAPHFSHRRLSNEWHATCGLRQRQVFWPQSRRIGSSTNRRHPDFVSHCPLVHTSFLGVRESCLGKPHARCPCCSLLQYTIRQVHWQRLWRRLSSHWKAATRSGRSNEKSSSRSLLSGTHTSRLNS